MLYCIALLTFFRFRGFYQKERSKHYQKDKDEIEFSEKIKQPHILLGIFYAFLATGILLTFLPRLLLLFEDYDPKFLYVIIQSSGLVSEKYIEEAQNYDSETPFFKSLYYIVAYFSLIGFVSMIMGARFMILYANKSHITSFKMFLSGVLICTFTGFTTFMPIFL